MSIPRMIARVRFAHLFVLTLGWITATAPLNAAPDPNLQDQQKNLQSLRSRIESLRKELNSSESARRKAIQEVKDTETQIKQLQGDLDVLARKRAALEHKLSDLKRQSDELSRRIASQQAQLENALRSQYLQGAPDTLQNLVNGHDPAQLARDQHYLTLLAQSRKEMVADYKNDLAEKQRLSADVQTRTVELNVLLEQQKQKQAEQVKKRDRHQELVSALSGKVEKQKQEIGTLQQDEKRLTQLIDRLIEQIARKAREQRLAAEAASRNKKPSGQASTTAATTTETTKPPLTGLTANLKMPVHGPIAGRFGSPRDGGGTWKGLFIHANRGTPVKAIANGHVVFADWMRGFGNLLILDHGDGYLSIYGYNEALQRKQGETVKNGETIAAVGTNGGDSESGLYFEIRHQGRPLDPLKWASTR